MTMTIQRRYASPLLGAYHAHLDRAVRLGITPLGWTQFLHIRNTIRATV